MIWRFALSILAVLMTTLSPVRADILRVVTDVPPVHSLVARVMDGIGTPDLILRGAVSPHSFALKPSQASDLQAADVVFWVGPALTPQLSDALQTLSSKAVKVALSDVPGTIHRAIRSDAIFGGEADAEHAEEDGESHDHLGDDPHLWLDPVNAIRWVASITETLAEADPANADTYRKNAVVTVRDLETLARDIETRMSAITPSYALAHDALGHFEARFGVPAVGALSNSDAAAPGPRRLADLKSAMEARAVVCLLVDATEPLPMAAALVADSDITVLEIDPLGLTMLPGPELYSAILTRLAETLEHCAAN